MEWIVYTVEDDKNIIHAIFYDIIMSTFFHIIYIYVDIFVCIFLCKDDSNILNLIRKYML